MKPYVILFSVVAGLSFMSCKAAKTLAQILDQMLEVKAVSFNIRYDADSDTGAQDWDDRKDRVAALLRLTHGDIFGLQEVQFHQWEYLQAALDGYDSYFLGRDPDNSGEACPIFFRRSRFGLLNSGTFWYSDTPDQASFGGPNWGNPSIRRICSWVQLRDEQTGKEFFVFNTHWHHNPEGQDGNLFRQRAAVLLADRIATRQPQLPFVVMGDLNAEPDEASVAYLLGDVSPLPLQDVYAEKNPGSNEGTFNGWTDEIEGTNRIDYIFTDPKDLVNSAYIRNAGTNTVSDHHAVVAGLWLVY